MDLASNELQVLLIPRYYLIFFVIYTYVIILRRSVFHINTGLNNATESETILKVCNKTIYANVRIYCIKQGIVA